MKKPKCKLHDEWVRIGQEALNELDISQGTVRVFNDDSGRYKKYKLDFVYRQLIRKAYEDGRKDRLPYNPL